ncbi:MAG: hypothetical protein ACREBE_13470, partial [bacterium]
LVPMAGLIDPAAEADRLGKRLAKTRDDLRREQVKLGNENFVRSAPEAVVAEVRQRASKFERDIAGLEGQLARVRSMLAG